MITIIFATYNGARTLPTMLESFRRLRDPGESWRLIAGNNASTDSTADILAEYTKYVPLTNLCIPERGKNRALNTALQYVSGDLTVLTDDDVIPKPTWLMQVRHVADALPDYDIFGGQIELRWPIDPPDWILSEVALGPVFASTAGLAEGPTLPTNIWGANMCVRTVLFTRHALRFNEHVGPASGNYVMGSETEFVARAAAAGHACWHTKGPTVEHIVLPEQLNAHWLLNRAYRAGRSRGLQEKNRNGRSPVATILGLPRWRVRKLLEEQARTLWFQLSRRRRLFFRHQQKVYHTMGVLYELAPPAIKPLMRKKLRQKVR